MKSFYAAEVVHDSDRGRSATTAVADGWTASTPHMRTRARVAVYESPGAAPRVEDIAPAPLAEFIEAFAARVYELAREQGGTAPYSAIREVTENFIHADFAEPVVSILDQGMTLRFADQGPGIRDKERAVQPGFTTAHGAMKRYIRGVGSGLPIVRDYLSISGGSIVIEDNLGGGSVVTLYVRRSPGPATTTSAVGPERPAHDADAATEALVPGDGFGRANASGQPRLSTRQKQVLALVLESGSAGPSLVAAELGCGVSTAYRDLASLEELGLIRSEAGKRTLTDEGLGCFNHLVTR